MSTTNGKTKNTHYKQKKTKVQDIVAMFGGQVSTKKLRKRRSKPHTRRNSETLRIHRKNLKNVKCSKKESVSKQIYCTPQLTTEISHSSLRSMVSDFSFDLDDMKPIDFDALHTNTTPINYDSEHCHFDALINETYGTPQTSRRGSQSSYLSLSTLSLDLAIEPTMVSETKQTKTDGNDCMDLPKNEKIVKSDMGENMLLSDTMYPMMNSDTAQLLQELNTYTTESEIEGTNLCFPRRSHSVGSTYECQNSKNGSDMVLFSTITDDKGCDYWIKRYNKMNKTDTKIDTVSAQSEISIIDEPESILCSKSVESSPNIQKREEESDFSFCGSMSSGNLKRASSGPIVVNDDQGTVYWITNQRKSKSKSKRQKSKSTKESEIEKSAESETKKIQISTIDEPESEDMFADEAIDEILIKRRSEDIAADMNDMLTLMSDSSGESISDIDTAPGDGISIPMNSMTGVIHSHFEMCIYDIGKIGAIKTSDYVKTPKRDTVVNDIFASSQYYIDSEDEYHSDEEAYTFASGNKQISAVTESTEVNHTNDTNEISVTKTEEYNKESVNMNDSFHERRERQIGMDLMDLMMSDSSSGESEDMGISELLERFGLFLVSDRDIYNYFSGVLRIVYVYQMIDILPSRITRPKNCFNMKQLIKLNRLVKYVSVQCGNNVWNGKYSKQWIGLESNYIYNIWQYKSFSLLNHSEYIHYYKSITSHKSDIILLNGFEKKYTHFMDINQLDKEIVFKMIVQDLPKKHRFENKLFKFGIETNDAQSLYICDRLNIRMNDRYLECMFLDKFVENSSFVFMKLQTIHSKDGKFLNITFCHQPNMQYTRFDHSEFSKDYQIRLEKSTRNCQIFLEQYAGNGQYIVDH